MTFPARSHRARVYESYISTRHETFTPCTIDCLARHAAYYQSLIARHFPTDRNAKILELGCGYGILIHYLRQTGYREVEGVDISKEQVVAARQFGLDCVREGDIVETLNASADGSYDLLLMFDILEHFRADELFEIADATRRVLSTGGRLICRVPNAEAPFASRMRYGDLTHELLFTQDSLGQVLMGAGFSRVDCFDDTPVVFDLKSLLRRCLWNGMRAWLRLWLSVETGGYARKALFSQNFIVVATK